MTDKLDYKSSGVDIDNYMSTLGDVKSMISATATKGVLRDVGAFGGIFDMAQSGCARPYLVSSIDGVGTKLKVAQMAGRFDTVGQDLVNHCCDDILVQGARPLFFMDYFGTGRLEGAIFKDVVKGLATACKHAGCALIAGETAEMPGLYTDSDFDLVGSIVGVVDADSVITGDEIKEGDVLLGVPSTGLHTNGYSLARKILFDVKKYDINMPVAELGGTIADALLAVHRLYSPEVLEIASKTKIAGLAHITGGGLGDNVVRVLPDNVDAVIEKASIAPLPVFDFLQKEGNIDEAEMYKVFNMGVGLVVAVDKNSADTVLSQLQSTWAGSSVIGHVRKHTGGKRVELV